MKDYFDLWILAQHTDFHGDTLRKAIRATFDRRKTALTGEPPIGLTDNFSNDAHKQTQWLAFLRKNRLEALALKDVIATLAVFFGPVIKAANANTACVIQ